MCRDPETAAGPGCLSIEPRRTPRVGEGGRTRSRPREIGPWVGALPERVSTASGRVPAANWVEAAGCMLAAETWKGG